MRVDEVWYVNEYRTNREYGGPEEGGWWYDTGGFVETHAMFTKLDEASAFCAADEQVRHLDEMNEGERPPSSVLCRGWHEILIQKHPGEHYPRERPFCE